jgi:hypothetical protein
VVVIQKRPIPRQEVIILEWARPAEQQKTDSRPAVVSQDK